MLFILAVIIFIHPILGDECVDTVGWNDQVNNFTCANYITTGWCVNKTFILSIQNNSAAMLNFPDLNCCACGKRESLHLPPIARWAKSAITVAGAADGTDGSSQNRLSGNFGVFWADGILYVADTGNNRILLIAPNSTTAIREIGGSSAPGIFNSPTDVLVTSTAVYVMDTWSFRVQKWSKGFFNPIIIAGVSEKNGNSTDMTKLSSAQNLFVDNYGNLFVSDLDNHRVMRFSWNSTSGSAGVIVAGTGTPGNASNQLNTPFGLFVTDDGTLYIAECWNHRIQKWLKGADSGVTVAGTGTYGRGASQLKWPTTVLVDLNGYIYITDSGNHRVMRWAPNSRVGECIVACSGYLGVGANMLNQLTSMTFDPSGSLYVNDWKNNRVQKFEMINETAETLTSSPMTTIETTASTTMSLQLPSTAQWSQNGITVAGAADGTSGSSLNRLTDNFGVFWADGILYVADTGNNRILLIAPNSTTAIAVASEFSEETAFNAPTDIIVTSTSMYVMDTWSFRVQKWSKDSFNPVTIAGVSGRNGSSTDLTRLSSAQNLFVDNYGNMFVGDRQNHRVMRFSWNSTSGSAGVMVAGIGTPGRASNELNRPSGIFVTDDETLYIADCGNHRIQKWLKGSDSGVMVAGTGTYGGGVSELGSPITVLVDLNGYMYITDLGNHRIMRWAPNARVGECIVACTGKSGVGSNMLNTPTSMAFDASGSLYVNDWKNNRVQKFEILNETGVTSGSTGSTTGRTMVSTTKTTRGMITTNSTRQTQTTSATNSTTTTYSIATSNESSIPVVSVMLLWIQIFG